ncbi:HDOD domain-containing protein [Amphritea japonica]|uniref:HDOD domain-containing protein n=1 Tax=Amphritea japonica ATCC BAA-1530 TaxID=1278309 RepID=A0A7R6SRV8_9GAMM|nr:HDOD domain-containing protein [Amphritea japonica]BBB25585.1 conserved hypothetical protein [Amphritea japonica ATCC BAA-1530]
MDELSKRISTLEFVKNRIDNLPLLPSVAHELNQLSQDSVEFYAKVAELAEQDPPLAAKVLAAAHSSSSGAHKPEYKIENALERMGVFNTLQLMGALVKTDVFEPTKPGHKGGWRHSVETAKFCRFLAEHMPGFKVDPDLAYMSGLLHDIGRFILLQVAIKAVEVVDDTGWNSPEELTDVEDKLFGFTHAEVGYLAAQHWKLPGTITNMLRYHHHYNLWEIEGLSLKFKQLLTIVQFADFLSVLIITHPDWPAWSEDELREKVTSFCIHKKWPEIEFPIDQLIAEMPAINEECQKVLMKAGIV